MSAFKLDEPPKWQSTTAHQAAVQYFYVESKKKEFSMKELVVGALLGVVGTVAVGFAQSYYKNDKELHALTTKQIPDIEENLKEIKQDTREIRKDVGQVQSDLSEIKGRLAPR